MNKKDEFKIEVLSNIDDEIVEKQSCKRYHLMQKNKYSRKKIFGWSSAAASLLLVAAMIFVLVVPIFLKQVPIYEGMTVSNNMPAKTLLEDAFASPYTLMNLSAEEEVSVMLLSGENKSNGKKKGIRLPDLADESNKNTSLYYAKKNEDIYITIHITNPENFEILSFTLNGVKYQSYMFEDGSNSEQLILKVNVGDAEKLAEYTIDAIKYVDGTKIKDVRMEGERTVKVAVYPDTQPTVNIDDASLGFENVKFDISFEDTLSLVKESSGSIWAILYDGESVVSERELTLDGEQQIEFDSLTPGKEYRCQIVANYDSLDGEGFGRYLLYEETFVTKSFVEVKFRARERSNAIFFDISVSESAENLSVTKVDLLVGDNVFFSGDSSFDGMEGLTYGSYRVYVEYTYGENGEKTGCYMTAESVDVSDMGEIEDIVKGGAISNKYSGDMQVYNPTTGDYRSHRGVDIKTNGADNGAYSCIYGKVTEISSGGTVVITSADGRVVFKYQSMTDILVELGDTVSFGQRIGTIGSTLPEESTEDDHLHLELSIDGEEKDPEEFLG